MNTVTKHSYPKGTTVHCWQFLLPITGWVGGTDKEFWSNDKSKILALMEHCDRPKRMITSVSDGSEYEP